MTTVVRSRVLEQPAISPGSERRISPALMVGGLTNHGMTFASPLEIVCRRQLRQIPPAAQGLDQLDAGCHLLHMKVQRRLLVSR